MSDQQHEASMNEVADEKIRSKRLNLKLKRKGPLHDTLTGYDFTQDDPLGRAKAIRQKCLECTGGQYAEVRRCQITDCTLWSYRSGRLQRQKTVEKDGVSDQTLGQEGADTRHLN